MCLAAPPKVTKADATPLEHSDNKAKGGTFILLRDYLQSKGKQRGNLPTPPPLLMPVVSCLPPSILSGLGPHRTGGRDVGGNPCSSATWKMQNTFYRTTLYFAIIMKRYFSSYNDRECTKESGKTYSNSIFKISVFVEV